jgi:hypothetical protein
MANPPNSGDELKAETPKLDTSKMLKGGVATKVKASSNSKKLKTGTQKFNKKPTNHKAGSGPGGCGGPSTPTPDSIFKTVKKTNIPFNYPVDCCYTRADAMARLLKKQGITTRKIWLFAKNWGTPGATPDLAPQVNGAPVMFPNPVTGVMQPVRWVYHVAPIIEVPGPGGSKQIYVIDPSIANGPITPEQWRAIQGNPPGSYFEYSSSDAYFQNQKFHIYETSTPQKTENQLQKHRDSRDWAWMIHDLSTPGGSSGSGF